MFWECDNAESIRLPLASESQHSISERGKVERWSIPFWHPGLKICIGKTVESPLVKLQGYRY